MLAFSRCRMTYVIAMLNIGSKPLIIRHPRANRQLVARKYVVDVNRQVSDNIPSTVIVLEHKVAMDYPWHKETHSSVNSVCVF